MHIWDLLSRMLGILDFWQGGFSVVWNIMRIIYQNKIKNCFENYDV
jgi:hypothetical protein